VGLQPHEKHHPKTRALALGIRFADAAFAEKLQPAENTNLPIDVHVWVWFAASDAWHRCLTWMPSSCPCEKKCSSGILDDICREGPRLFRPAFAPSLYMPRRRDGAECPASLVLREAPGHAVEESLFDPTAPSGLTKRSAECRGGSLPRWADGKLLKG